MGLSSYLAQRLTNYDDPDSLGARMRRRRIGPMLAMIDTAYARFGRVNILDIGGTKTFWKIFPSEIFAKKSVKVTLLNLPDSSREVDDDKHFQTDFGDGCELPRYADDSFHIVHSNSVIEHVGDWTRMVGFAREVRRLAPDYFVQTPNFWFPVEPHFMVPLYHWLPDQVRANLLLHANLGHIARAANIDEAIRVVEAIRLLDRRTFSHLFPDATILTERLLFLPKSLIAIRTSAEIPSGFSVRPPGALG